VRSTLERIEHKIFPKHVAAYLQCPRKFQMMYVQNKKVWRDVPWHTTLGNVVHNALAAVFRHQRAGQPISSFESYAHSSLERIKSEASLSDDVRAEHLAVVLGHVSRAHAVVPPDAEVLHIEKVFQQSTRFSSLPASFDVASKIDLIIRHSEGRVVDHIDFKTGRYGGDPIQNVMSRFALMRKPEVANCELRTVNVLSQTGTYEVIPSDPEALHVPWQLVRESITALATDRDWEPTSDPAICRWCDFNKICDSVAKDPSEYDA
jgi:hypothetical protein